MQGVNHRAPSDIQLRFKLGDYSERFAFACVFLVCVVKLCLLGSESVWSRALGRKRLDRWAENRCRNEFVLSAGRRKNIYLKYLFESKQWVVHLGNSERQFLDVGMDYNKIIFAKQNKQRSDVISHQTRRRTSVGILAQHCLVYLGTASIFLVFQKRWL